jgi:hypothetical protein
LADRRFEGVLGKVLGEADVPDNPGQRGDQPGRLHSPNGVKDAMDVVLPARACLVRRVGQLVIG